jgi:hypothetical protein
MVRIGVTLGAFRKVATPTGSIIAELSLEPHLYIH